ncbi:MAG: ribosomal RNA small subunit methyltransferase A [Myxococcales bacterium]|nr:MAG: ribosomal RNA small subunit methyltransferase A [Myxococcales bacterium]
MLRWRDPRKVLREFNLEPSKRLSQNFLVSPHIVEGIAALVAKEPNMNVVEFGPGLGTLTRALLNRKCCVLAIEADPNMLNVLSKEFEGEEQLEVQRGDATAVDYPALQARFGAALHLAGNLPYAVTGQIFRHLCEHYTTISHAVFMVQKEVAMRLNAPVGTKSYGALTVFVNNLFHVEYAFTVKPGSFHPPPKVTSAVIELWPRDNEVAKEHTMFRAVVRASFDARRKTLRTALRGKFPQSVSAIDAALEACQIDPRRRGETLSVDEFAKLSRALQTFQDKPIAESS